MNLLLCITTKAINDARGPDGIVTSVLVFGDYTNVRWFGKPQMSTPHQPSMFLSLSRPENLWNNTLRTQESRVLLNIARYPRQTIYTIPEIASWFGMKERSRIKLVSSWVPSSLLTSTKKLRLYLLKKIRTHPFKASLSHKCNILLLRTRRSRRPLLPYLGETIAKRPWYIKNE